MTYIVVTSVLFFAVAFTLFVWSLAVMAKDQEDEDYANEFYDTYDKGDY